MFDLLWRGLFPCVCDIISLISPLRRIITLARKFRAFLVAVLAVVLCVPSAFGAATYTITKTNTSGDWGAYSSADKTLTINRNGIYTFSNFGAVSIDYVIIAEATASWDVKDAVIQLPGPVSGSWDITFPKNVRNPKNVIVSADNTNRTKLTITKGSVSTAAIVVDKALTWTLSQGNDLVIDAPLRVGTGTASSLGLTLTVGNAATATFTANADIHALKGVDDDDADLVTGYSASGVGAYAGQSATASTYTINAGGELIIRNASAIRGSNLTVTTATGTGSADKKATLTLDLTSGTTLDLRGVTGSASTNLETAGAKLKLDGSLCVSSDVTLRGKLGGYQNTTITKSGTGTLTLSNSGSSAYFTFPSISADVTTISIDAGSLVFASQRSVNTSTKYAAWAPTGTNPRVLVGKNAYFTANSSTIIQAGKAISFDVKGTATFKTHAILKKGTSTYDEIYPYEGYTNTTNTLKINAVDTALTITKPGKVIIDGGFLAAGVITGNGTIQIDGSSLDKAALILTSPDKEANYANFKGTISGTNANVGLYTTSETPFGPKIFRSADVTIDNLLVYGSAQLTVDANTNLDGVGYVWLRSDRPGAANFTSSGSINSTIASAQLTVGTLNFAPLTSKSSDIYLDCVKIDGTASSDVMGTVSVLSMDTKNFGLNVYLSNIELYANRGTGLDFTRYVNPYSGIYALRIDGAAQPSRIYIDGKTVTGDGLVADAASIYQVQITESSDVRFTGSGVFYPAAKNNSLLVNSDAKLEIDKGGIINGNLKFIAGTNPLSSVVGKWIIIDTIFTNNDGWYSSEAGGYTAFATHVGSENRRTGSTGEFAVKVTGNIVFDDSNIPNVGTTVEADGGKTQIEEGGFVVFRTQADPTAFDSSMTTTRGQRFMLLGTTGTGTTCDLTWNDEFTAIASGDEYILDAFLSNVQPAYETKFVFHPTSPKYMPTDVKGIIFESDNELAIIELGEASFLEGGSDFGMGDGYNFTVKIPFTVSVQGEQVDLKKEYTTGGYNYYIDSGAYKWYFKPYVAFLKFDSKYYTRDNVPDFDTLQQLSSSDIVASMTFDFSGTEPYIKIVGTSYSGTKAVPISAALYFEENASQDSTLKMINAVIPGFRDYSLIRDGSAHGDQYSTAAVTALSYVDITEGSSGNVSFTVSNFWKASTNSSLPTLIDGKYVWDNGADTGTYNMPDASGKSVTVSDVVLILYNGSSTSAAQTVLDSGFTITSSGTSSTVTLPITSLGTTGGTFDAIKMLAVRATRTEGTGNITTQPVSFTLHSANYASGSVDVSALTRTVRANETTSADYVIPASDLTGSISYIPYNVPSWLNLTTTGNTISYTTSSLQGVTLGKYDVSVLAYSGENSTSSPHKLYTFSITVTAPAPVSNDFSLRASSNLVAINLPSSAVVNLTPVRLSGSVRYTADRPWVTFSGDVATFAPTVPGSYDVTITATDTGRTTNNTATVSISVRVTAVFALNAPATAAITLPNSATISLNPANALGSVSYRSSHSWVTFSGDVATLAPTVPGSYDVTITAIDYGRTPPATVSASIAVTVRPASATSGDFTLTAGTTSQTITLPNTAAITLTPGNARGTVSYSANQSWVTFSGNTATFAPTSPGTYTVIITATDSGRTTNNTATATITLTVQAASSELIVSADKTNITVDPSGSATVILTPANAQPPITYTANYGWVTFDGNAATITPPAQGTYNVVITATDALNRTFSIHITVTAGAAPTSRDFVVSADKTALTITPPATGTLTLTAINAQGAVSYTANYGWVTFEGNTATIAPTEPGTYTVTITATDSQNRTAIVNVTVTLTETVNPPISGDFSLSADSTSLMITADSSGTITLTPNNAHGSVSYTASESWVTFDGNTATIAPTEEGIYTVTITATDSQNRTASIDVEVFVTADDGTFTLSAPTTVVLPYAGSGDVRLTPNNALGTVTYTAAVTPSTGLSASFTGNTMRLTSTGGAGSYTVRVTATDSGRSADNTATATIAVTVSASGMRVGSSGGGCDSGFGEITLAVLGLFLVKRRKN